MAKKRKPLSVKGMSLGAAADTLYKLREEKRELADQVAEIEADEATLRDYLIANVSKADATGVSGKIAKAIIRTDAKPTVKDWPKLYAFILKKKRFDLLQKRVADKAVSDMWAEGEKVPGVDRFNVVKVALTKVR